MTGPRAPWWMYVIAASFLAFFALISYYEFFGPDVSGVFFEFPVENPKGRMVIVGAPMSPALERAGAKPGDYIVRVDGQELYTVSDWLAIAANLEVGRRVRLGLERAARQFEVEAIFERHQMSVSTDDLMLLASAVWELLVLVVGLFIAFSRPWDPSARLGALCLAAASGSGGPQYFVPYGAAAGWRHLPALAGALLWLPCIASTVLAWLFCTFFAVFPRKLFRTSWPWAIIWTPALLIMPLDIRRTPAAVYRPTHTTGLFPDWVMWTWVPLSGTYCVVALVRHLLRGRFGDAHGPSPPTGGP